MPVMLAADAPPGILLGRWALDISRSSYKPGPAPYVSGVRVITSARGDMVKITDDLVRPRGGVVHVEWTGRLDGNDYPAEGFEDYSITYAYSRVDDHTYDVVQRSDGKAVGSARMTLSADGRTMTTVSSATGTTTIYDRVAP